MLLSFFFFFFFFFFLFGFFGIFFLARLPFGSLWWCKSVQEGLALSCLTCSWYLSFFFFSISSSTLWTNQSVPNMHRQWMFHHGMLLYASKRSVYEYRSFLSFFSSFFLLLSLLSVVWSFFLDRMTTSKEGKTDCAFVISMGIVGVKSTAGREVKFVDPSMTTRGESAWLGYTLCDLSRSFFS